MEENVKLLSIPNDRSSMACATAAITNRKICLVGSIAETFWAFYSGLIKRLRQLSVEVTIATSDGPALHDFENKLGCRVFPIEITRRMSPLRDLLVIYRLASHFRRERYDIVHAHNPKGRDGRDDSCDTCGRVGQGSWLSSHVTVVAGTTIGRGTIVGANAVASKNLPNNVFAARAPARVIGPRVDKKPDTLSRFERL